MFTKRTKSMGLAIVTGLTPLLLTAAPVFASTPASPSANAGQPANMAAQMTQPGTTASTASAPSNSWLQIAPHSTQWFRFKYSCDDSNTDNTPTQAFVKLVMQNPDSVNFQVWTPGRLQNPQYDPKDTHHLNGKLEPVGVGTPMFVRETHERRADGTRKVDEQVNADILTWQGSARASDTYYVVVKNTTDAPANYSLAVSGPDVSY